MDELPQELKDLVDNVRQEKIDNGATYAEATDETIKWLEGIAAYIQKHKN
jgi:hypothetical protein